jgi:hypothetical protein
LYNLDIFFDHFEYFTDIWDILWHFVHLVLFGTFFLVWVSCTKKNLPTLPLGTKFTPGGQLQPWPPCFSQAPSWQSLDIRGPGLPRPEKPHPRRQRPGPGDNLIIKKII